jgi:RNA ligase
MKYKFPHINTIDDVLPAIEGAPEFIVADKDDYIVVNYVVAMTDTFPEVNTAGGSAKMREEATRHKAIRRECRGIIFNKDGSILSRRLHKFFNVNERDETLSHKIDFSQPHVILEKLDGSMITPIKIGDHIRWGTKMGVTQVAMGAEEFVAKNPQYADFARWCIDDAGVTPIFEWCSRKQRIVVDYPEDRLVFVAARDIKTGEYANYDWLQAFGSKYNIEVVKAYAGTTKSMEHLIEETRGQEGIEGWIIRFDDGHMVKVKGDWYVRIHKTKDAISQEKNIVSSIVNETIDDSKAFMLEEDRKRVEEFEREFINGSNSSVQIYEQLLEHYRSKYDRKNFALNSEDLHPHLRSIMFSCWDGNKNVRDEVFNIIKRNVGSQSKIDEVRHLWGGKRWNYNSSDGE